MIEGTSVRLRAPERADLPLFLKWINDPEVTEFLPIEPPASPQEEETWFEEMVRSRDQIFCIETKDGRLIGNCGLTGLDWKHRRTEVGIMIGEKESWSHGYGADALATLIRHLFEELGLNRVALIAVESNVRAVRCFERCGFRKEGVLRSYLYKRGRYVDCVQMSMLRPEWGSPPAEYGTE